MRICLTTLHAGRHFPPLSLLYIKAYLVQQHGSAYGDTPILEFYEDSPLDDIVTRILDLEPDVLGVACYVWNIKKMLAATRLAKTLRPGLKIVLGGPEVGPIAQDVLDRQPHVDAIVVSEGEIPFAQLIAKWNEGGSIEDVK
jgi:radical SAM superfamily enzyme YgiQ (UPF0313 family)